jgi:ubiquitin thioesterase OTU1
MGSELWYMAPFLRDQVSMRLRARTSKGQIVLGETLDPSTSTIGDIKKELIALGFESVNIKVGFPPKVVNDDATLAAANVRNGDCIVVEDFQKASVVIPKESVKVREMKDDNSCLFRSIGYIFLRNPEMVAELRQIVSQTILSDPLNYSNAILGQDRLEYCKWIQKPDSWGGAIELAIFSKHFNTEITSIDVATGRMDRFGQGDYTHRAYVMYSGIHYDAIVQEGRHLSDDIVIFDADNVEVEQKVRALADDWRRSRKFTDLANFTLKCSVCLVGLKGQKDAQEHALRSGHSQFTEY